MLRKSLPLLAAMLFSLVVAPSVFANVRLPDVFSDHMVLQQKMDVAVWGTAEAGEEVTVSIADQTVTTKADKEGKWSLKLKPLAAGGPHTLTVQGKNKVELKDVLVGEVWVGSGQSNMAGGASGYSKNDEVLAKLIETSYPQLRLCRGGGGGWMEANPQNNARFSALLFSFGQKLQEELDVPVGVIVGAVGGTPSGRWLSEEMLASDEACQAEIKEQAPKQDYAKQLADFEKVYAEWEKIAKAAEAEGKQAPRPPLKPAKIGEIHRGSMGDLYDSHIRPIVPYTIRGVLWDQGESGTALVGLNQHLVMGALIEGWRNAWGQGEFPFLYVQKYSGGGCAWDYENPVTRMADKFTAQPANFTGNNSGDYRAEHIRIKNYPNTAMVTARDLGGGIHPLNKSGYGHRAVRVALGQAYGKDVEIYGPVYESHKVEGNKVRLRFSHVGEGLASKHGDGLQGFEIAGKDGAFHWAEAKIEGDEVVVSSEKVAEPTTVRYAWAMKAPWANLFNKDGLPALAFSTDQP